MSFNQLSHICIIFYIVGLDKNILMIPQGKKAGNFIKTLFVVTSFVKLLQSTF